MKAVAKRKPRIKKEIIKINGKSVPLYKIPTGMSGLDQNEVDNDDDTPEEAESKEIQEQKRAIEMYMDTGVIEHNFVEDNIQMIDPNYGDSDLFDKYE